MGCASMQGVDAGGKRDLTGEDVAFTVHHSKGLVISLMRES